MTTETDQFLEYWNRNFEIPPIDFELKWNLKNRWFRIHSLPKAKRYPESKEEYDIILFRQQEIFNDLIGEGQEIFCVLGLFEDKSKKELTRESELGTFDKSFTINLQATIPKGNYDQEDLFGVYSKKLTYHFNKFKDILVKVMDDNYDTRIMLVDFSKNILFVPYDGGMDIILESEHKRNEIKNKYLHWTSNRDDGL